MLVGLVTFRRAVTMLGVIVTFRREWQNEGSVGWLQRVALFPLRELVAGKASHSENR